MRDEVLGLYDELIQALTDRRDECDDGDRRDDYDTLIDHLQDDRRTLEAYGKCLGD